jgi:uncharacterized protein YcgL (UPF0745 family)
MQVDRYKSDRDTNLYLLVEYRHEAPHFHSEAVGTFSPVGAADTRAYSDELCNEIEEAIRSRGYWLGDLPEH